MGIKKKIRRRGRSSSTKQTKISSRKEIQYKQDNQKEDLAFSYEIFDFSIKEKVKDGAILLTIDKKRI
jgi:hypothetical protein